AEDPAASRARAAAVRGCAGTYASPPRRPDNRVDAPALLAQLKDLRADTYNFLVWRAATDWDDLRAFLPEAVKQDVKVWVTLVPPSESPPRTSAYSEPYRLDYDRWAVEIAKLGVAHPNLVAWSIDDFALNQPTFTPDATRRMLAAARAINPRLAFVPVVYWRFVKPGPAAPPLAAYRGLFDAVLYPYRNDSVKQNLTDTGTVKPEVDRLRELLGPDLTVIVDVYQTKHSRAGSSTPAYVRAVMAEARRAADGVMVYTHPNPTTEPDKYAAVRDGFAARP
ncbi:MAG: hypothetical protein JWO31_1037, partial [Phycisphaerales bacterium]|nr:hypothetical protein [Phycisphaerales bacterium]